MTSVNITPIAEPDELFHHYPGQTEQQDVVISLDLEDGELTCRYNPEIGNALPESVWNGRTLWLGIPCLTADAANAFLGEVAPIAQRILDGAEIVWDGSNHVGRLDDDALAARDELCDLCAAENFELNQTVEGMGASNWFSTVSSSELISQLGLTADTTDAEIIEKAREEEGDARTSGEAGYTVLTGVEEYLTELRNELRDARREELNTVALQLADLEQRLVDLVRQIRNWGDDRDSLRALGALARKSHMEIKRIVDTDVREVRVTQVETALREAGDRGVTAHELVSLLHDRFGVSTNRLQMIAALAVIASREVASGRLEQRLPRPGMGDALLDGRYYWRPAAPSQ